MATDFYKKGAPKMGWDYSGGTAGRSSRSPKPQDYSRALAARQRQLEIEKRASEAQAATYQALNDRVASTFYKDHVMSDVDALNVMWDGATNEMIDVYHGIVSDKDTTGREKARGTNKLLRWVPLVKNAKNILDNRMTEWDEAVLGDDVSTAFPSKFQQIFSELRDGKFNGGIVVDGDVMRFKGKTSKGEDIDMPLQDFEAHIPKVYKKGMSYLDATIAEVELWDAAHAEFIKTGKNRVTFDRQAVKDRAEESIASYGREGEKIFAYDTLGYTDESWEPLWKSFVGTEITDNVMNETQLEALRQSVDPKTKKPTYTEEQLKVFSEPKSYIATESQAKEKALDIVLDQYADGMEGMFKASNKNYATASSTFMTEDDKFNRNKAIATSNFIDIIRGKTTTGEEVSVDIADLGSGIGKWNPSNQKGYANANMTDDGRFITFNDLDWLDAHEEDTTNKTNKADKYWNKKIDLLNRQDLKKFMLNYWGIGASQKGSKWHNRLETRWNDRGGNILQKIKDAIEVKAAAKIKAMQTPDTPSRVNFIKNQGITQEKRDKYNEILHREGPTAANKYAEELKTLENKYKN